MQGGTRGSDITLRREAERTLKSSMLPPEEMPTEYAQRLVHELRVHQIELEMQNEELRRVQNELEISVRVMQTSMILRLLVTLP